jgi:hypothetical protein
VSNGARPCHCVWGSTQTRLRLVPPLTKPSRTASRAPSRYKTASESTATVTLLAARACTDVRAGRLLQENGHLPYARRESSRMPTQSNLESPGRIPGRWVVWVAVCVGLAGLAIGLYFLGALLGGAKGSPYSVGASPSVRLSPAPPPLDPVAAAGFRVAPIPTNQAGVSGDAALTTAYMAAEIRAGAQHQALETGADFGDVYRSKHLLCRCWVFVMVDVRKPLCPGTRVDAQFVYLVDGKSAAIVAAVTEPAPVGTTFGSCAGP